MRVLDAQGADLRYAEDEARYHQTPDAGGFEDFDKEVGADSCKARIS